jgi:EmrB/QacA subfamily drug resistance transporter
VPNAGEPRTSARPGIALAIMLGAQLMIILDATVVNIALPHIQQGLRFSATSLSWVVNGYTLTFGGLLLLGGRAGDILGRRRMFIAGIVVFTLASLAGGLAPDAGVLLAARAVQGVGAALASPAVLALVISGFADGKERIRALAIYTGVITAGGSLGLVLGGLITQWASWRWVLFVNVPIGVIVTLLAPRFVAETPRLPGKFDLTGALTSTAGVALLVYAFTRAAASGWSDHLAIASFVIAAALLAAFVATETRAQQPITPLRLFASAGRSGSYAARLMLTGGMFGMFFFVTQFLQDVLGFSPLRTGIAFLPMTLLLFGASRLTPRLMRIVGPWRLMLVSMVPVIAGMAWLTQVTPDTSYWGGVFGPLVLFGMGGGSVFVPLTSTSLAGVRPEDSGAASSLVNVMQQLGGSVGLAALVAIFGTAAKSAQAHPAAGLTAAAQAHRVLAHGVSAAFALAAVFDVTCLLIIALLLRPRPAEPARSDGPAATLAPVPAAAGDAAD